MFTFISTTLHVIFSLFLAKANFIFLIFASIMLVLLLASVMLVVKTSDNSLSLSGPVYFSAQGIIEKTCCWIEVLLMAG